MGRVTVKDIAHHLNISLGTVSRALTGKSGVSEETRKSVLKTADALGYKVNRLAQSLARNPITIGVIAPELWPQYYGFLEKGIKNYLERLRDNNVTGKFRHISSLYSGDEIRNSIDSFIEQDVNAVIICPAFDTSYGEYLDKLYDRNIPVVLLGTDLPDGKRLSCIRSDANTAGRIAGEFMGWIIPENTSAIAFIGNKDMQDHRDKVEGFTQELQSIPKRVAGVYETQDEPEVAYHLTKKAIREIPDIGGIYVATGNSVAVCECIVEHGLNEKIKVIATDVFSDIKKYVDERVIQGVIFQDPVRQGELAVNAIYEYIAEGRECERNIYVQPQLILRNASPVT